MKLYFVIFLLTACSVVVVSSFGLSWKKLTREAITAVAFGVTTIGVPALAEEVKSMSSIMVVYDGEKVKK